MIERGHGLRVPAVLGVRQYQRVAMIHDVGLSRLTHARPEVGDEIPQKLVADTAVCSRLTRSPATEGRALRRV